MDEWQGKRMRYGWRKYDLDGERLDGREELNGEWMGRMDGWMDEWMNGWMDA